MTPEAWRLDSKISLAAAAALVGLTGRNPARTWRRWEVGLRRPPLRVVAKIEELSSGAVRAADWVVNAANTPTPDDTCVRAESSSDDPICETLKLPIADEVRDNSARPRQQGFERSA